MPKLDTTPQALKPLVSHGVELALTTGAAQAVGTCPWCGREGKFYASSADGRWDCKICMAHGNGITFIRQLWGQALQQTTGHAGLAEDRRLMHTQTLGDWGVRQSHLTGEWLVPGWGVDGKLVQLYRYVKVGGRKMLLPTPGLPQGHGLLGVPLYDSKCKGVYVCEGPWDGMALLETMGQVKRADNGLTQTGSQSSSLLGTASVLAVPSCSVWKEDWSRLLAGKEVYLLYDNDHPRKHPKTGALIPPAGLTGMRNVVRALSRAGGQPKSVGYLAWGPDGYDAALKDGYDVRDHLCAGPSLAVRARRLGDLLGKLVPVPRDWVEDAVAPGNGPESKNGVHAGPGGGRGSVALTTLPCTDYAALTREWRKAMKWTPDLDRALAVMLACVASTRSLDDQLWVRVIGRPSSGKTTLCEALSVARKYVYPKDTMTGLLSGYQLDREGSENISLVGQLHNKTLVVKDGDTLLQLANLGQVMSQLRAFYDRSIRSQYGNLMSRDWEGLNTTVILCGTRRLQQQLDNSELGERFVDCVVMENMDDALEDEILWRVANRVDRNVGVESNGQVESRHDPDLITAMRMTGGYVEYLCADAPAKLAGVRADEGALRYCMRLGKFVAHMRTRPSVTARPDAAVAEREMASRLVSQLVRLAKCLAVVLNRTSFDSEVLGRVRQAALDTSRGRTFRLVGVLYDGGVGGVDAGTAYHDAGETPLQGQKLLADLRQLGVAESVRVPVGPGLRPRERWRLTPLMRALYADVVGVTSGKEE
jgi:hypothetical protein